MRAPCGAPVLSLGDHRRRRSFVALPQHRLLDERATRVDLRELRASLAAAAAPAAAQPAAVAAASVAAPAAIPTDAAVRTGAAVRVV